MDLANWPPVGRLAPSPTGAQHLGNARTYLLAWLAARSVGGRVVLRIEDIDSPRVKPWAVDQAVEDLRWLGLDWDEGPDVGGPNVPYVQTERAADYAAALDQLIRHGHCYPCVCTRTDIAQAASAPHAGQEGPRYPGSCSAWQLGEPLPPPGSFCWRFRTDDIPVTIDDQVAGLITLVPSVDLGDFPLTRKTGEAAYQLAVVVDDAAMEVNQVVRGDDLLPSAFRQAALFAALQLPLPLPRYAHVPLVVGGDGRRLAKRHGDTRLSAFRAAGVPPQRIIGWAAWSAGLIDRWEEIQPADLVADFQWSQLNRRPVVVDSVVERRLMGHAS